MKQEIAFAWADKLDSGEYKQDKEQLKTLLGFCCLGVLCDMYIKAHPGDLDARWTFMDKMFFCHNGNAILPSKVISWAGMRSTLGRYTKDGKVSTLTKDNDTLGKTFPEIAKIIRENWETL